MNVTDEGPGSPETVQDAEGADTVHDCPELDVAVYDNSVPVPAAIGASHETVADDPVANVAEGELGAQGAAICDERPRATSTRNIGMV